MVTHRKLAINSIQLKQRDQQALRAFVNYLHTLLPDKVDFVALFGSKARGEGHQNSDIDVLVILAQEDRILRREILRQAARLSLMYDVILSPRVVGAERWQKMRGFSLYQNVQRDAIELNFDGV